MEEPDAIAEALTEKLVIYATGRRVEVGDRDALEAILEATESKQHGLRSLIHAITESELFLRP